MSSTQVFKIHEHIISKIVEINNIKYNKQNSHKYNYNI